MCFNFGILVKTENDLEIQKQEQFENPQNKQILKLSLLFQFDGDVDKTNYSVTRTQQSTSVGVWRRKTGQSALPGRRRLRT